jgi:hypothetical protein
MNTHSLISKFIAQICEKQYAFANSTLSTILEGKLKAKIKKEALKKKSKKPFFMKNKKMANKKNK